MVTKNLNFKNKKLKVLGKKAQIQMTETIMVLLIFLVLMFAGFYIYYKYTAKDIQQSSIDIKEKQSRVFLRVFASMPEFSHTSSELDTLKLIAFKQAYKQNKNHYERLFGRKKIIIQQIYPESDEKECSFSKTSYPNCNTYTIYDSPLPNSEKSSILSFPTSLYFPITNTNTIGKIIITNYE